MGDWLWFALQAAVLMSGGFAVGYDVGRRRLANELHEMLKDSSDEP